MGVRANLGGAGVSILDRFTASPPTLPCLSRLGDLFSDGFAAARGFTGSIAFFFCKTPVIDWRRLTAGPAELALPAKGAVLCVFAGAAIGAGNRCPPRDGVTTRAAAGD